MKLPTKWFNLAILSRVLIWRSHFTWSNCLMLVSKVESCIWGHHKGIWSPKVYTVSTLFLISLPSLPPTPSHSSPFPFLLSSSLPLFSLPSSSSPSSSSLPFSADIAELSLPKTCQLEFPEQDDLLNFRLVITPDEVRQPHVTGLH